MDLSMPAVLELLIQYRYLILFPLALIEGPFIAFVAGIVVALGYFNPWIAFLIMVLGDLIPDAFFFFLGYFGKDSETVRRYRIKFGLHDEHFEKARQLWREHPGKTMFMTKFAYGLSTPFLIMAGLLNMPARIFFSYSIAISMIHYAIMMTLGYLFGESLSSIGSIATAFQIGVAVLAVVMIAYYFGVRYLRSKVEW